MANSADFASTAVTKQMFFFQLDIALRLLGVKLWAVAKEMPDHSSYMQSGDSIWLLVSKGQYIRIIP